MHEVDTNFCHAYNTTACSLSRMFDSAGTDSGDQPRLLILQEGMDSMEAMEKALKFVLLWGGILAVILIPIWPLLALAAGTFSQGQLNAS